MRPVVLVHGIWDTSRSFRVLARGLSTLGISQIALVDFDPITGLASLEALAEQVAEVVRQTRARTGATHVDLLGFSMGALVSRWYLQRLGGAAEAKRFVSISGPHQGTWTAYGLPFPGVRQMRPGSALLHALRDHQEELEQVAVHCLYTPYDAMIVPTLSSVLPGARSVHRVPVLLHRWMLSDARVSRIVGAILGEQ